MIAIKSLAVFAVLFFVTGCGKFSPQSALAEPRPTRESHAQGSSPLQLPLKSPRILVKKAERRLFLYSENRLMRTYRIGLGLSPVGDKIRSGDHRTPEGDFY